MGEKKIRERGLVGEKNSPAQDMGQGGGKKNLKKFGHREGTKGGGA